MKTKAESGNMKKLCFISIAALLGSSVKCTDAFRIAITEEAKLLIKQKYTKTVNYLFFYHPLTLKTFSI